eukprot:CAMPEP_0113873568 /NCGR_PEP_ID=MMETSP0780_2-20120614/3842_1 /TAXON_ID=652834 /ORGANISM="Palpitomonas bilix" /LENGTH=156 /DNA_ID=CAMNT_0000859227 /DNA_START=248 /DNA_END=714 /DNA_ORIENTATION=+ /assembly_acc=CAM_ASM_000599
MSLLQEVHYTQLGAPAGARPTLLLPSQSGEEKDNAFLVGDRATTDGKVKAMVVGKGGHTTLAEVSTAGRQAGAASDEFLATSRFHLFFDTDGAEILSVAAVPRLPRGMPENAQEMERARRLGAAAFAVAYAERSNSDPLSMRVDRAVGEKVEEGKG